MTKNPNEMERYEVSPDQLDALYARTVEQMGADREARQRAAEWPGEVEGALVGLANGLRSQAGTLADIDARIAKLEAKLGLARD